MLYLNESDILKIGVNWNREIDVIEYAVSRLAQGDYSQPIKPYVRFRDPANRIIAMPAYIGGDFHAAGIKWIASFPGNIKKGLPRANSVTIVNNAETGQPVAIINTSIISAIRTAAVSGLLVRRFEETRNLQDISIGIIGFGPIGKSHLDMLDSLLGDKISKIYLYDISGIQPGEVPQATEKVEICHTWEEVYVNSDIFVTCTVSKSGYIDLKPKDHSLLLNVSLRDFKPEVLNYTKSIIVDNWEEVCREQTDIHQMHIDMGLQKEQTRSIVDVVNEQSLADINSTEAIMFNPMGMAVFDVAIAHHFYNLALNEQVGVRLED